LHGVGNQAKRRTKIGADGLGQEVSEKSPARINILSCRSQAFDGRSTGFPQAGFVGSSWPP